MYKEDNGYVNECKHNHGCLCNYQNNYKTGTANKKKETAQTTENTKLKENTTESITEKNLSKAAQKMLENLRGTRNDMDFMVADLKMVVMPKIF